MGSVKLHRIGTLAKAAVILCATAALAGLASALTTRSLVGDAEAYLAGTTDDQAFIESILPYFLVTVIQMVLLIAASVVVMIWMFRIATNHRTLHRGGTWGPGWAIGGWFLPPMLFVIPFLTFRQLWKSSDPGTPIGSDWRSNRVSPIVPVWFVMYSLLPPALLINQGTSTFSGFGNQERAMAETIIEDGTIALISAFVSIAGAIAFGIMARGLTSRHQQLTGELRR